MSYLTEDPKWYSFYPRFNRSFYVEKAGYFDERPQLHTSVTQLIALFAMLISIFYTPFGFLFFPFIFFGWGKLYIHFPIKTGIQDCCSAAWGIDFHDNKIWIAIGGGGNFEGGTKFKTFTMPWDMTWVRKSTLMADGTFFVETEGNRKTYSGSDVGSYEWLEKNKWKEIHDYTDSYDNVKVHATISHSEMEWRPLGFQWTTLFSKSRRYLDIEFDKEVGKRKGEWKGGCIGCSYEIRNGETPLECLRRMEKERKF